MAKSENSWLSSSINFNIVFRRVKLFYHTGDRKDGKLLFGVPQNRNGSADSHLLALTLQQIHFTRVISVVTCSLMSTSSSHLSTHHKIMRRLLATSMLRFLVQPRSKYTRDRANKKTTGAWRLFSHIWTWCKSFSNAVAIESCCYIVVRSA